MIQKIVKNSDIKFCVDDDSKIQDKFIIKFYTIDKSKGITRTADDVITVNEKRYIKLNWSTIKLLDNGMLNYEVNNLDSDADYDDGVYNSTFTRTTYYYLCTDGDGLADAIEEIELRVDQITTDITDEKTARENGDAQLAENLKNTSDGLTATVNGLRDIINGLGESVSDYSNSIGELQMTCELYGSQIQTVDNRSTNNKGNITDLQNRISSVETKSTNNENSINTMSTEYAALVSRLEKLEANGTNKPVSLDDRVSVLENSKKSLDARIEEARQIIYHLSTNYGDSNYNMLDNDLTILESRVSTLENSTQGNNESTSSLATNNDSIANRPSALETEPSALETEPSALETEPSALETEPSALETEPSALETEPSALETNNDSLVNRVSALEDKFRGFDKRMLKVEKKTKDYVIRFPKWSSYTQISNTLGAFRYRVEALENGTQGNNESISSLETNSDNIVNRVSALATNNDSIANRMSVVEDRASALETDNDSLVNRVSALENSTYLTDATIQNFQDYIIDFDTNWKNNSANWLYISNRLTELNMKITALETR